MKLEFQWKSLAYNLDGSLKGTIVTLGHMDGGHLPVVHRRLRPAVKDELITQGFYWPKWNGTEWVEGGVAPEQTEPEPQVPTMEEVAIALMNIQAELKATTEALDFLIMGEM